MPQLDRRQILLGSAALAAGGAPALAAAAAGGPPVARVQPVTEEIFGVRLTDPYRWMETTTDPDWKPFLLGQNAHARQVLGTIPGREALAQKIGAVTGVLTAVTAVQAAGAYIFTEVRPPGANTFKLFVREGRSGKDRLLLDPDLRASASTHYSLDYWSASPDGRHVLVGVSPAGSEDSVIEIIETATGKSLPERIDRAQFGSPSWLPDGSGFFFVRLKEGTKHGDPDHYSDSVNWLHKLGTEPSADLKVMTRGLDPAVVMQDIDVPVVLVQAGCEAAIGLVARGVLNEVEAHVAPLASVAAGRPRWSPLASFSDDVTGVGMRGKDLYLLTHKNAPRFRLLKTSAANPSLADAKEVVPQSRMVLKGFGAARDAVYVQALDAGLGKVIRLAPDDRLQSLRLPYPGTVSQLSTDPLQDGCWFMLDSWVRPPALCYGAPDGAVTVTDIAPKPPIDVSRYASQEVMVTARDGVKVPLSIVYAKGVKRDGTAPLYLQAYGAYALDIDPGFSPRFLPWLDLGGVYAVAHVRGGGELGEDWHKAGQKLTKPHTWRDCIDAARWLIANKWTNSPKLAVEGTSAGGIMVGQFLTEAPGLLGVAVVRVGDSNATRFEFMEAGPANIPEFGTIKDRDGFKGLLEMDAYQHVKDGVAYPAVMLTTGMTDPRVAPWEAMKMTARLQKATSSGKPVILRVETDAGHGL
ncbi:prolyl oligopeptidase family serine peptidase, partial [Phenylobacterium sp.]|uniref:prolyl oligopeptidase family serine peptidase n=1 Tax=Phenylobacterium sp. TaxID=1871053 RepID=UPI002DEBA728|nr:prolyl oligopeptidase family serine peptidase [Phenylobacterium sp.]